VSCTYALKVYADDFADRVWAHALELAGCSGIAPDAVCLPIRYLPDERLLVFPWVEGPCLADIADDRCAALFRSAADLAASLHRLAIVPEPPTTPAQLVAHVAARCEHLRHRWPDAVPVMEPLVSALVDAASLLDPAEPALVHGDLWAGQLVWTGERLVMLDLDAFGYTDPAYDVGHFLAQLERGGLLDRGRAARATAWGACFLEAYRAAMPGISTRNVAFYRALTLARKIHTVRRTEPAAWPRLAAALARRARAALDEMASATVSAG
jgi:aminoglycoside phosphotransferase (APT) family kinase protein